MSSVRYLSVYEILKHAFVPEESIVCHLPERCVGVARECLLTLDGVCDVTVWTNVEGLGVIEHTKYLLKSEARM